MVVIQGLAQQQRRGSFAVAGIGKAAWKNSIGKLRPHAAHIGCRNAE
jgi:hypothetical protein